MEPGRKRLRRGLMILLFVFGVVVVLLGCLALAVRRDQLARMREEIQYDDFAWSAQDVKKVDQIGSVRAQGIFYIVTVKVANHARRVPFTFHRGDIALIDDQGVARFTSAAGQAELEKQPDYHSEGPVEIPAGDFCTRQLAFDLPKESARAKLVVSTGGTVGHVLDLIFYGDKRISLE